MEDFEMDESGADEMVADEAVDYGELGKDLFKYEPGEKEAVEAELAAKAAAAREALAAKAAAKDGDAEGEQAPETQAAEGAPAEGEAAEEKEDEGEEKPEEQAAEEEKPEDKGLEALKLKAAEAKLEQRVVKQRLELKKMQEELARDIEQMTAYKAALRDIDKDPLGVLQKLGKDPKSIYGRITEQLVQGNQGTEPKPGEAPEVVELKQQLQAMQQKIEQREKEAMVKEWRAGVLQAIAGNHEKLSALSRLAKNNQAKAFERIEGAYLDYVNKVGEEPPLDDLLEAVHNDLVTEAQLLLGSTGSQQNLGSPPQQNPAPQGAGQAQANGATQNRSQATESTAKGAPGMTLTGSNSASSSNPRPIDEDEAFDDAVIALKKGWRASP